MSCGKGCTGVMEYDFTQLNEVLNTYASTEGSLITILQKAQDIFGYLPRLFDT